MAFCALRGSRCAGLVVACLLSVVCVRPADAIVLRIDSFEPLAGVTPSGVYTTPGLFSWDQHYTSYDPVVVAPNVPGATAATDMRWTYQMASAENSTPSIKAGFRMSITVEDDDSDLPVWYRFDVLLNGQSLSAIERTAAGFSPAIVNSQFERFTTPTGGSSGGSTATRGATFASFPTMSHGVSKNSSFSGSGGQGTATFVYEFEWNLNVTNSNVSRYASLGGLDTNLIPDFGPLQEYASYPDVDPELLGQFFTFSVTVLAIPEPSTLTLAAMGLAAVSIVVARSRRSRRRV